MTLHEIQTKIGPMVKVADFGSDGKIYSQDRLRGFRQCNWAQGRY